MPVGLPVSQLDKDEDALNKPALSENRQALFHLLPE
jgi:hypothetical protein